MDGAYYDVAANVAVRLTNLTTSEYYSRYWKARQLTASDWYSDGTYIYIPASAFSNVLYEMFKIDSTRYYASNSNRYVDNWTQPRGYIAFKGPGLDTNNLKVSQDSLSYWYGFYRNCQLPGAPSQMSPMCVARYAKSSIILSVVLLPTVSVKPLPQQKVRLLLLSLSSASPVPSPAPVHRPSRQQCRYGFLVNQSHAVTLREF